MLAVGVPALTSCLRVEPWPWRPELSHFQLESGVPRCEDVTMQPGIWPACQAEPSFLTGTVTRAQGTAWLCDLCGTRRPPGTKQCSHGFRPDPQRGDESRPAFPGCRWSSLRYQVVSPPAGHFLGRAPAGMCRREGTPVGMTSPLAFLPSLW